MVFTRVNGHHRLSVQDANAWCVSILNEIGVTLVWHAPMTRVNKRVGDGQEARDFEGEARFGSNWPTGGLRVSQNGGSSVGVPAGSEGSRWGGRRSCS